MDIDKQTLKAISVESRLQILKKLAERRMLPSELSKRLSLAPSTVIEHLKLLEQTELIKRKETGHKWIYYEITEKGLNIIRPRAEVRFALTLILGIAVTFIGFAGLLSSRLYYTMGTATPAMVAEKATDITQRSLESAILQPDIAYSIVVVVGILLIVFGLIKVRK